MMVSITAFQQEIAELRASEVKSGEIGDISPLAKTAESMHEKVKGPFLNKGDMISWTDMSRHMV